MENQIELSKNDPRISRLVGLTDYKGRKSIKVIARVNCSVNDYWSGGSRYYAQFDRLDDNLEGGVQFTQQVQGNPYNLRMGTAELKPNGVMIESIIFQGKQLPPRIYIHPDDYQRLFGA